MNNRYGVSAAFMKNAFRVPTAFMKNGFRISAAFICLCTACIMIGCTGGTGKKGQPDTVSADAQAVGNTNVTNSAKDTETAEVPDGTQNAEATKASDGAQTQGAVKLDIEQAKLPSGYWDVGEITSENCYDRLLGEWILYKSESGGDEWYAEDEGVCATTRFLASEMADYHFAAGGNETAYLNMEPQFLEEPLWDDADCGWSFLMYPREDDSVVLEVLPGREFLLVVAYSDEDDVIMTFLRGADEKGQEPTGAPSQETSAVQTQEPTGTGTQETTGAQEQEGADTQEQGTTGAPSQETSAAQPQEPTDIPPQETSGASASRPDFEALLKKGEIVLFNDGNATLLPGIYFGDGIYFDPIVQSVEAVYEDVFERAREGKGTYNFPANLTREDMLAVADLIADLPGVSLVEISEQVRYPSCNEYGVSVTYDGLMFYLYAQKNGDISLLDEQGRQTYSKAEEIVGQAQRFATVYEKEVFFHDYLVKYITYDNFDEKETGQTPYGALVLGRCVCTGYARAMRLLLLMSEIDCLEVWGSARGETHVWNKVNIGGEWYNVDVTWDDPTGSSDPDAIQYTYLNVTDAEMRIGHTWDNSGLPACTATEYNYMRRQK